MRNRRPPPMTAHLCRRFAAPGQSDEELEVVEVSLELDFESEPDSDFDSDFEAPSLAAFADSFFA